MQFNSLTFLVFFPITAAAYYLVPHPVRKYILLAASSVFYLWTYPAMGLFTLAAALSSYLFGRALARAKELGRDKAAHNLFTAAVVLHAALLILFKYGKEMLLSFERQFDPSLESVLVPMGVSYFTFQMIGYLFDVRRGDIEAERDFAVYALYVTFFPTVSAGPIQRAKEMLPQFREKHEFSYSGTVEGMQRLLTGAFRKIVMGDGLRMIVDPVFNPTRLRDYTGFTLILAVVLYSFELYFDFSGYSDMAAGLAKILGFKIRENFRAPFLATSMNGLWERWHMSLTTWFRDYLYIPLGGSRKGETRRVLNISVVFLVSGLWHGDTANFLVWGAMHAFIRVCEIFWARRFPGPGKSPGFFSRCIRRQGTLALWTVTLVVFRASSLSDAWYFFRSIPVGLSPGTAVTQAMYFISEGIGQTGVYYLFWFGIMLPGALIMAHFDRMVFDKGASLNPLASFRPSIRWLLYWFFGLSVMLFYFLSVTRLGGSPNFSYGNF